MTSLTDKMEGLRRETPSELDIWSDRTTPKVIGDTGFNRGVDACIALTKAEAAVVGDWEAEFDSKYIRGNFGITPCVVGVVPFKSLKGFISDLLTAKDREREEAGVSKERTRIAQALSYLIDTNNDDKPIKLGDLEQMILHPYTPAPFIQRPIPPTK